MRMIEMIEMIGMAATRTMVTRIATLIQTRIQIVIVMVFAVEIVIIQVIAQ